MKYCWCLITALLVSPSVGAAGPPVMTAPVFSVHDLDRDGYLDRLEFERLRADCRAQRARRGRRLCALEFDALDANGDGRIGEEELLAALPWRGRRFRMPPRGRGRAGGGPAAHIRGPH